MFAKLFAVVTALLRSFSSISSKKGIQDSTPTTSVIVSLTVRTVLLWLSAIILYPSDLCVADGIEYFILAGIIGPGLAGLCMNIGFDRLGVGITSPIINTSTLFAVLGAVIFLGEKATFFVMLGAILVVVGVSVLTRRGERTARWKTSDLLFPLAAALMFASSTDISKMGLTVANYPILAAAITSTVSLITLLIYLFFTKNFQTLNFNKNAVKLFSVSGLFNGAATLCFFVALSSGDVSLVQPIAGSTPLFAVLFSHFLLREVEKITTMIVLGAILVVSGVTLVFL